LLYIDYGLAYESIIFGLLAYFQNKNETTFLFLT